MRLCPACGTDKPEGDFYRCKNGTGGLALRCKRCDNAVKAAWRASNKERQRTTRAAEYTRNREREAAQKAAWKAANPDRVSAQKHRYRAAKISAPTDGHSSAELAWHLSLFAAGCFYCGAGFDDTNPRHIDHVVPLARGGSDSLANLVPACRGCNLAKGSKTLAQWAATRISALQF